MSCYERGILQLQDDERRTTMQPRAVTPLPLLDGDSWVYRGLLRTLQDYPDAMIGKVPRTSPWAGVLALAKALVDNYESRSRVARREGVHLHDTGFPWLALLIVLFVVLVVAGATITVLCAIGTITDGTVCTIGLVMLLIGLNLPCVVEIPGVSCAITFGGGFDG
jgi:hypothetical protein